MARAGDAIEEPSSNLRLTSREAAEENSASETKERKEYLMFRAEEAAGTVPASEARRYYLIEVEVAPGGGNTPHYHKTYDEHFEVLEGALEVLVGQETRILRPGQKAVAKKNVLHRFRNTTGSGPGSSSSSGRATRGSRRRSRSPTAWRPMASPPPTGLRETSTTRRCSWSGRIYGCPAYTE